jgi:hypothetical protein
MPGNKDVFYQCKAEGDEFHVEHAGASTNVLHQFMIFVSSLNARSATKTDTGDAVFEVLSVDSRDADPLVTPGLVEFRIKVHAPLSANNDTLRAHIEHVLKQSGITRFSVRLASEASA